MLIETDFSKQADTLLLGEAGGAEPNPDETLTEAEFLISVLKDNNIVDDMTVNAIRLQFAHITRHDTWTQGVDNKVLDDRIVFLEMKSQGRIAQMAPGAGEEMEDGSKIDLVDLQTEDGGFAEWLERYWWPRVFDGKPVGPQVRLQPVPATTKAVHKGEDRKFQRLQEDEAEEVRAKSNTTRASSSHRSPRLLPTAPFGASTSDAHGKRSGGYYMDGQMAVADGEYVWMPHEQAQRHRAKSGDRDLGLWLLVGLFALYFFWKMVPTIIQKHRVDYSAQDRRILSGADTFISAAYQPSLWGKEGVTDGMAR